MIDRSIDLMYVCDACVYVCVYVCMCVYVYVCVYVCVYVRPRILESEGIRDGVWWSEGGVLELEFKMVMGIE